MTYKCTTHFKGSLLKVRNSLQIFSQGVVITNNNFCVLYTNSYHIMIYPNFVFSFLIHSFNCTLYFHWEQHRMIGVGSWPQTASALSSQAKGPNALACSQLDKGIVANLF